MKFTEEKIQDVLAEELAQRGHLCILPNTFAVERANESDLVSVTKNRYVWTYEIKISRSDFKADMKKYRHRRFREPEMYPHYKRPNRFYYAVPEGLVEDYAVPEYAGLIWIVPSKKNDTCSVKTVKTAPLLHKEELPYRTLMSMCQIATYRYWQLSRNQKLRDMQNTVKHIRAMRDEAIKWLSKAEIDKKNIRSHLDFAKHALKRKEWEVW